MSLAEELLADLDSEHEDQDLDVELEEKVIEDDASSEIKGALKLLHTLEPILERIAKTPINIKISGNIDNHPSYKVLVEANDYSVEIDNEVLVVHKFIKQLYAKRYSELESLVVNPVNYTKTVKQIGNNVDNVNDLQSELMNYLNGGVIMTITMSAYENRGKNLDENELKLLNQACDLLLSLDSAKQTITKFVSSQLSVFAPNVTSIIDSHTAAQIMGFAGGVSGLSKTPSSNIPSLGAKQQRQTGIGFSNIGVRQQGFLYNSEIIQSVPMDQRVQAMRMVAGKLVLAARVDLVHSSTDGTQGKKWRNEIQERLDKLLEPPENKATKALPIPEDKPSKKRGGKRIRKFKEQFKQTELQKAQNRISFGENGHADDSIYYDDDEEGDTIGFQPTVSLNDLSTGGSVRNINIDSKVKARMSKAMQQRVQKVGGLTSSIASVIPASGLSSTFVAPVQAVQLGQQSSLNQSVNGDKWFNSGTFTSIKKDHAGIPLGKRKIDLPCPEPKKRSK